MTATATTTERVTLLVADKEVVVDGAGVHVGGQLVMTLGEAIAGSAYVADPVMAAAERLLGLFGGRITGRRVRRVPVSEGDVF